MKKIFTIVVCFISIAVNAQQFRYGALISPCVDWWKVEGDLYESVGIKPGVQLGVIIDQTLGSSERFALTSGLNFNFAPGGFKSASTNPNNSGDNAKEWNYTILAADLPLTIRLRSDELNKTVLYAQYGVTLGFTINASAKNASGQNAGGNFDYENMNTSLTMGVGAEHKLSERSSLLIGAFFQNGIVNTLIDDANDDNMFPQQAGLRVGLLF